MFVPTQLMSSNNVLEMLSVCAFIMFISQPTILNELSNVTSRVMIKIKIIFFAYTNFSTIIKVVYAYTKTMTFRIKTSSEVTVQYR